jgi:hypothetical protein
MVAFSNTLNTVTTLDACRALFALNREVKQLDNIALKRLIYSLKDRAVHALYAQGLCVGASIEDESWLVVFTFQVDGEVFAFHMPLARVRFPFEERDPDVVGRYTVPRRMTPKECGANVNTVARWLNQV